MRHRFLFPLGASLLLSLFAAAPDARACGGCVVPPLESTQVTGHRMVLAVSMEQTSLYDQIEYSGNPESFAWFLPIKGEVDVGLSADALFAYLGDASQVTVYPPQLPCVDSYGNYAVAESADPGSGDGSSSVYVPPEEQVNVISQKVVGPYETVQLEATSPGALTKWLEDHGYAVPDDVQPIINDYQAEGFGFLAMKLVPGQGVTSMRPVRVTTKGASLGLPLRMVAAGTGAVTPVTLYVMSEGRYEVDSRPNLTVNPDLVVWDWDQSISNYRDLRDAAVDGSQGLGWLTESALPFGKTALINRVTQTIQVSPGTTGWGDPDAGVTEADDAQKDLDTLFRGMDQNSIWLTRMYARLSRAALASDLMLRASADQAKIPTTITAKTGTGTEPDCSAISEFGPGRRPVFSCGFTAPSGAGLVTGAGLFAALGLARRRRARKEAARLEAGRNRREGGES